MLTNNGSMNIKVLLVFSFLVFCYSTTFAQIEPRPKWVKNIPQPKENSNHIYVVGMGIDATEELAIRKAWINVIEKSSHELQGVQISRQMLTDVYEKGLDAAIKNQILPRRELCSTLPIYVENNKVKVYILVMVQRDVNKSNDFYTAKPLELEDIEFDKALEEYNKTFFVKNAKIRRKQERIEMKLEKQSLRLEKVFFLRQENRWIAFGIGSGANFGCNNIIGASFLARTGKTVGIGFNMGIGLSIYGEDVLDYHYYEGLNKTRHASFLAWGGGVNIYLYKRFYINLNYGTVGAQETKIYEYIYDYDGSVTGIWDYGYKYSISYGPTFTVGYDFFLGDFPGRKGYVDEDKPRWMINAALGIRGYGDNKWSFYQLSYFKPIWSVGICVIF